MSSTNSRGRPETKVVDRLRVAMWSAAVQEASGLEDAKAFEEHLAKKHKIRIGKGLWARYLRGDVLPQGALNGAKSSLPYRLEKIYPGTARHFISDMWNLIEWDSIIDLNTLRTMYLNLGDDVAVHFVSKAQSGRERVFPMEATFWHMNKTLDERKRVYKLFPPFIRLVVDLLEARMAYAAQRPDVFVYCQLDACTTLADLQRDAAVRGTPFMGLMLMIEGLCLDVLLVHVMNKKSDSPKMKFFGDKARSQIQGWVWKCVEHLKSLPTKTRGDFANRLNTWTICGSDVDFLSMVKVKKFEHRENFDLFK